jgi:hypothetical protein
MGLIQLESTTKERLAEILPEDFQSTRHIEEPFIDWWTRYKVLTILIYN